MTAHLPHRSIIRDFQRDVWCLFGLPVDNLTMESAKRLIREKVKEQGNCVLSTINVNWVVESMKDPAFRKAIINSDLVTLDGRPLLWLAKLLGYPMQEVVAGSSLIEELLNETDAAAAPLTLYLFGGEDGVARQAMERVNQRDGGLRAVGCCSPGFGSVEQLSSKKIIDEINAAKPDILLVALGAKKGTQWIEHNRDILEAKIICHLGATINFLAGTVVRAPQFLQKIGMEWMWRILQEPKLARRYLTDGLGLLKIIFLHLRLWVRYSCWKREYIAVDKSEIPIRAEEKENEILIVLGRSILQKDTELIKKIFSKCAIENKNLQLDFQYSQFLNENLFGWILMLIKYSSFEDKKSLVLKNLSSELKDYFLFFQLSKYCNIFFNSTNK